jgi:hypothetical protein
MLTRAEFLSLARYSNGRIVYLSHMFFRLTQPQVRELSSEDQTEYQMLRAEFAAEVEQMIG